MPRAGNTDEGDAHRTDGADETDTAWADARSPRSLGRPLSRGGYRSDRFYGFRGLLRDHASLRAPSLGTATPKLFFAVEKDGCAALAPTRDDPFDRYNPSDLYPPRLRGRPYGRGDGGSARRRYPSHPPHPSHAYPLRPCGRPTSVWPA